MPGLKSSRFFLHTDSYQLICKPPVQVFINFCTSFSNNLFTGFDKKESCCFLARDLDHLKDTLEYFRLLPSPLLPLSLPPPVIFHLFIFIFKSWLTTLYQFSFIISSWQIRMTGQRDKLSSCQICKQIPILPLLIIARRIFKRTYNCLLFFLMNFSTLLLKLHCYNTYKKKIQAKTLHMQTANESALIFITALLSFSTC